MQLLHPSIISVRRRCQLGCALTGLAMVASAYAAAPPLPIKNDSDAVVVTDAPLKQPMKHRDVKPGPAKPKAWPSKSLPLLVAPSQARSPS